MGQQAMATTLAARATNEEVIATEMAAQMAALGAGDTTPMQDKKNQETQEEERALERLEPEHLHHAE